MLLSWNGKVVEIKKAKVYVCKLFSKDVIKGLYFSLTEKSLLCFGYTEIQG